MGVAKSNATVQAEFLYQPKKILPFTDSSSGASKLDFEQALSLRDVIFELKAMGEKNGNRKK